MVIIREDYEYKNRWIKKIMNEMSIQYFFIIKFQVACTYCDSVIHICGTFSCRCGCNFGKKKLALCFYPHTTGYRNRPVLLQKLPSLLGDII